MEGGRDHLLLPATRLPDLAFPTTGGGTRRLRDAGRRSPVLVLTHGPGCARCADFLARLAANADALDAWDPLVLVAAPGTPGVEPGTGGAGAPVALADPEGRLAAALSLRPPALLVADRWGEVHARWEAGEAHAFPTPGEVEGWLRYLAIQCPECQGEAY